MPGRKLGKPTDQRLAMHRQQVTDFLDKGRMETNVTRAKELRPIAEKMITLGKKNTLASRRTALAFITREDVVTKLFAELAPKYAARQGGYCRITRIGPRRGDASEMAVIELVEGGAAAKARTLAPPIAPAAAATPAAAEVEEVVTDAEVLEEDTEEAEAEAAEEAVEALEVEAEATEEEAPAETEAAAEEAPAEAEDKEE